MCCTSSRNMWSPTHRAPGMEALAQPPIVQRLHREGGHSFPPAAISDRPSPAKGIADQACLLLLVPFLQQ
jgi:hypothetical protein